MQFIYLGDGPGLNKPAVGADQLFRVVCSSSSPVTSSTATFARTLTRSAARRPGPDEPPNRDGYQRSARHNLLAKFMDHHIARETADDFCNQILPECGRIVLFRRGSASWFSQPSPERTIGVILMDLVLRYSEVAPVPEPDWPTDLALSSSASTLVVQIDCTWIDKPPSSVLLVLRAGFATRAHAVRQDADSNLALFARQSPGCRSLQPRQAGSRADQARTRR